MDKNIWLKKIGILGAIFFFVLIFNLNKSRVYEAETAILVLPKNATMAGQLDSITENFRAVLASLAFNDRISEGSDALAPGVELPNAKRKEFWNSKLAVMRVDESGVLRIKNFDADSTLAKELNADTVDSLIAIAGSYYNIKTDLDLRIVDGPIVQRIASQNLTLTIGKSILWSLGLYLVFFFLLPFMFIKRDGKRREIPGRDFSRKISSTQKPKPLIIPEEENYFAAKNFFPPTQKPQVAVEVEVKKAQLPKSGFFPSTFPSFGKKAPTPANLPVSEEAVPDIFRQKEPTPEVKKVALEPIKEEDKAELEYISREATPEEVKARLNRLLGGGK
jgi:hypothetical protein